MIGPTDTQGASSSYVRPPSFSTPSKVSTPAAPGTSPAPSLEGEGQSQPAQDKAAASVINNLPRACPDGCQCAACSSTNPLAAFQQRDQEVQKHEQAHLQQAGPDALGQPDYETQTGPDGKAYRVGGHVQVSLNEDESNPQQTLDRMKRVEKAALAPDEPSSQDQNVAQQARQKEGKAQAQLQKKQAGGGPGAMPGQAKVASASGPSAPVPSTSGLPATGST